MASIASSNPNGILGCSILLWSISMDVKSDPVQPDDQQKSWFAILGLPSDHEMHRIEKLMKGLRKDFGGPEFEPHLTVVGLTVLTQDDAVKRFRSAVDGMKAYPAKVEAVASGTSYYDCVFLQLQPSPEVVEASVHCSAHFGYNSTTPYKPHISLLYGDLSDEQKKDALVKANKLDECINKWEFDITRLVLQKVPRLDDKTTKSWENIAECNLITNSCT
ncbi:hypothetical protein V2J09_019577 [Rumex salicifolius]